MKFDPYLPTENCVEIAVLDTEDLTNNENSTCSNCSKQEKCFCQRIYYEFTKNYKKYKINTNSNYVFDRSRKRILVKNYLEEDIDWISFSYKNKLRNFRNL